MNRVDLAKETVRSGGEASIDAVDVGLGGIFEIANLAAEHGARLRISRAGILNEIEKRLLRQKLPGRVRFQDEARSHWTE